MTDPVQTCALCDAELVAGGAAAGGGTVTQTCPACGALQTTHVFPALARRQERAAAAARAREGEAVCFHHADRQAAAVCDTCGCFLCGLCHIDFNGRPLCPSCLARTRAAAAEPHIPRCVRYDKLALLCIMLAPFLYIVSFVNAGASLFLCFRHWRSPLGVLPRRRWRFVVAGTLAVAVLALWGALAVTFTNAFIRGRAAAQAVQAAEVEDGQ